MKGRNLLAAGGVFVLLFLVAGNALAQAPGKVTMEQWLKLIAPQGATESPPPKTAEPGNAPADSYPANSGAPAERQGIPVTGPDRTTSRRAADDAGPNIPDAGGSPLPASAGSRMPQTTEGASDTAIETKSIVVGQAGGTVILGDGASLTAAAGVFTSATGVTLSRIGNPAYFGNTGNLTYEVSKNAVAAGMTLSVPLETGLASDRIAVVQYSPDIPAAADDIPCTATQVSYDAGIGLATIALAGSASMADKSEAERIALLTSDEKIRVTVETPAATASRRTVVPPLRIPYYQQVGPSCWAADAAMIAGAYGAVVNIPTLLKAMNRSDTPGAGWGIKAWEFNKVFPVAMKIAAGMNFRTAMYLNKDNLREELVRLLDMGYPVMMHLPADAIAGAGAHMVVFVGYEQSPNPADAGYLFTIMDPKGDSPATARDGGMYSVRPWQWFLDWFRPYALYLPPPIVVAWVDKPAPVPAPAVASLGTPGGGFPVGDFAFSVPKPETDPIAISLTYKPSAPGATAWGSGGKTFYDLIPNNAETLDIRLPVWNSGTAPFAGAVKVDVLQAGERAGGKSFPVASGPGPKPVYVTGSIAVKDFRGPDDVQNMTPPPLPYAVLVTLEDSGGRRIDGFTADFVLQPGPRITDVIPAVADPGDTISIVGRNFGDYHFAGKVMIAGVAADVATWSDTRIEATVPAGPPHGDVAVAIAELKSNVFPLGRKTKTAGVAANEGKGTWVMYDVSRGSKDENPDPSHITLGDDGLAGSYMFTDFDGQRKEARVEVSWSIPPAQLAPGSSITLTATVTNGSLLWPGRYIDEPPNTYRGTTTLVVPEVNGVGTLGDLYSISFNAGGRSGPGYKVWNGVTFKYRYVRTGEQAPSTPAFQLKSDHK